MKVALFYYDDFAEFEIAIAGLILHHQHEIISIALEQREYRSEETQRFCVDQAIKDVDIDSIDLLIIPGGEPASLIENQELKTFIGKLLSRNKKVAAICGGAELLAGMGMLKGRRCTGGTQGEKPGQAGYPYFDGAQYCDDHVVVDGNIITAQGRAYVEFAIEIARQVGICKSQEDYEDGVKYFKNIH